MNILNIKASLIVIGFLLASNISAQTDAEVSNYDLPPGAFLSPKFDTDKDMSEIINEIKHKAVENSNEDEKAKFLKPDITQEDWDRLKKYNPEEYEYYQRALNFYDNLSERVKIIIDTDDLWYIYKFKVESREELTKY